MRYSIENKEFIQKIKMVHNIGKLSNMANLMHLSQIMSPMIMKNGVQLVDSKWY